jgi:two-component system, OmpR family, sensor kinase
MKIRYKISLLITSAGVIVSLIFSIFVYYKMTRVTYNYIDNELKTITLILNRLAMDSLNRAEPFNPDNQFPEVNRYLVKLYDQNLNKIYENVLSRGIDFPLKNIEKGRYTTALQVPHERSGLDTNLDGEVTVRVRNSNFFIHGFQYHIQIGKPIERMDREYEELAWNIAAGFCAAIVLIAVSSYFLAGLIIRPISQINRFTGDIIDEKTIGKRLPLGRGRDELYVLSDSLNRMFDRLQYSFIRQKQFIANASHELKSPLAVSLLFLEKAVQRDDLPEAFRVDLIHHYDILLRMRRLVKSLLDLAAMELTDRIEAISFCFVDLVTSVIEDYRAVFTERNVALFLKMPEILPIEADRDKINRVIINLIDNALKFNTDETGKIEIIVSEKADRIHFSIENTGQGISPEDLPHVFEQFYRAEKSRSPKYGGAGLGLALVKRIVDLHKGTVTVESKIGSFTRVNFVLPKYYR